MEGSLESLPFFKNYIIFLHCIVINNNSYYHIYVQTTCKVNFASDDPFKMKHTTQFTDVWAHQITGICAIV